MGKPYCVTIKIGNVSKINELNIADAIRKLILGYEDLSCIKNKIEKSNKDINSLNFEELITLFLADNNQMQGVTSFGKNVFYNAFDASYGYQEVLELLFKSIAPFVRSDAYMVINDFEDSKTYISHEGKAWVSL